VLIGFFRETHIGKKDTEGIFEIEIGAEKISTMK
jgi:hypothetical protein